MAIRVPRKRADSYQHGDLRHALIQAGLKLLGEEGVRGLSLRAAAELAGVSHAAPYRHFKDKDALVQAIAEEGFRSLTRHLRAEIAACGDADLLARLSAAAVGYVSFAVEQPGYFRIIFGSAVSGEVCQSLREAGTDAYGVLRGLVVEGMERGRLRQGDPDELSLAAWSLVHGLANLMIDRLGPPGLTVDPSRIRTVTTRLSQLLQEGLTPPASVNG
jgi:AcrR family transcriptional regulator